MVCEFTALPDTDGDGLHDAEGAYGQKVAGDINGDGFIDRETLQDISGENPLDISKWQK